MRLKTIQFILSLIYKVGAIGMLFLSFNWGYPFESTYFKNLLHRDKTELVTNSIDLKWMISKAYQFVMYKSVDKADIGHPSKYFIKQYNLYFNKMIRILLGYQKQQLILIPGTPFLKAVSKQNIPHLSAEDDFILS